MIDFVCTKIRNRLKFYYKLFIRREKSACDYLRWVRDHGDETLRLNYPLTSDSVVFDVGGFCGDWAEKMAVLYDPNIYVFEPIQSNVQHINAKLSHNRKIHVYNFGLSDRDEFTKMALLDDGTSAFKAADEEVGVELRDIQGVLDELSLPQIDLMKINIEGGEYPLLQRIIDTNTIKNVIDIQIQFHDFVPEAKAKHQNIRNQLMHTHYITYDYEFVWENWKRRE